PRPLLHCIVAVNVLLVLWEFYLVFRQRSKHNSAEKRPDDVENIITEEDYTKARSYSLDHLSFSLLRMTVECGLSLMKLYGFYYALLWSLSTSLSVYPIAVFIILHSIIDFVVDLPLSLYENFVIEEKHGFNKYTLAFYLGDSIKKLVLSTVVTIPLYMGASWLIDNGGDMFFIYIWVLVSLVIFAALTIYPAFIAPLFDTYVPLPEGELKKAIEALAEKLHYPLTKIYVVDGSTRSGHSNAYMYGFWKNKRIVLYSTLLCGEEKKKVEEALGKEEEMSEDGKAKKDDGKGMGVDEVVAIVAHELGHWALSHTVRQLLMAELNILLSLFCFSFFHKNKMLAAAFGFPGGAPAFIALMVIMQYVLVVYNEVWSLVTVWMTRKMEFEADQYAAELGYSDKLTSALIKLGKDNLSVPVNDKLFSLCRHTHPPVPERLAALKK
ncbi:hypothetical protein PFISCL1PPCAC_21662, partial [Pristionchus fissidentatus]